ncbi:nucleotide-binding protein [Paraliomyxa miuraensis]|uniref:nucleotide-binding protein n=1 Tax=Paraliomyxa miuraensis TaxID=376150 RepID=UPI002251920A|nr:nucleotide-binding protein [Paraliomyxa miuraensis]MCX4245304.1 nucleotide-binding protein [Paraliomyxa miuraensis]
MKRLVTALGLVAAASGCKDREPDPMTTERCAELDVPQLFVEKCSTAACHEGSTPAADLDLVSPGLETRLVLKPATQCPGVIADPSDPEGSVLVEKLQPDPSCGVVMPLGMEPLPEEDVACVIEWVSGLVPPTGDGTSTSSDTDDGSTSDTDDPVPEMCTPGEMRACYSGLPETEGVAMCIGGMQSCLADLSWGPCEGEVPPVGENCNTATDENCDGQTPACSDVWVIGYNQIDNQQARAVAVDRTNDDVIVVGDFEGTVVFGDGPHASDNGKHDIFLQRYDHFGNPIWTRIFGDSSNQYAGDVIVDGDGSIILIGRAFGIIDFGGAPLDARGTDDVFIAKLGANGNHIWSSMVGGIDPDRSERVAVDPSGNVYVTGTFTGDATFGGTQFASLGLRDMFLVKLAANNGTIEWAQRVGGAGDDYGWGVAADDTGVYFTGYFGETVSVDGTQLSADDEADVMLGKFDPDGVVLWALSAGGVGHDQGYDLALAPGGEIVVTGAFTTSLDFGGVSSALTSAGLRDIFLARFSPDGTALWANAYGDDRDQFENDFEVNTWPSLAIGDDGTIHLAGSLAGAAYFGGPGDMISAGKVDAYLVRFDADGNWLSAQRWGGAGTESAVGVDADSTGASLIAGRYFSSGFEIVPAGPLVGYGNADGFVAKLPPP